MTVVRQLKHLGLFVALVIVVVACGTTPVGDEKPEPPLEVVFSALPLEKGNGEWQLFWSTDASEVTIDGELVAASGSQEVIHSDPHTYELVARRGSQATTEQVTLAGLSALNVRALNDAPLIQEPGLTLQLVAEVEAEGSSVPPSQTVTWQSMNPEVATVDDNGLVSVLTFGVAEIRATSAQWTGLVKGVQVVAEKVPVIESFAAEPWLDGDGQWRLSWAVDAQAAELNGVPVDLESSLVVNPATQEPFVLVARNGTATVSSEIVLAPVSSVSIPGFTEPLRLLPGASRTLYPQVNAAGSDIAPAQAVTWSSDSRAVTVADGRLEALYDPGEPVYVTVRSVQSPAVQLDVQVEVAGTAIADFDFAGTVPLEAGSAIELTWSNAGASALSITPIVTNDVHRSVLGLDASAQQTLIEVPLDKGWVNFELWWRDPDGSTHTQLLWPDLQPVNGWVCNYADDDVITFPDSVLRSQVEDLLERLFGPRSPGPISCQDVQRPTGTNIVDGQEQTNLINNNRCDEDANPDPSVPAIESLEGIQHLTRLYRLELECNELTDISRLAHLSGLVDLNLDNNLISDLTPLSGLTQLEALGLYNNEVTNLHGLEELINLEILYLSRNQIKDVSPIAGLSNVRLLWLYLNCETDDDVHYYNCLSDLSPLSGLHSLETLNIAENAISDLSFITPAMDHLQHLGASHNHIRSIEPLSGLQSLRTVAVDENFLSSVAALASNPHFPAGPPYTYSRGTASLISTYHLGLGWNCFDPTVDSAVADMLADSVIIEGVDIEPKTSEECAVEPSTSGLMWLRLPNNEITHPRHGL